MGWRLTLERAASGKPWSVRVRPGLGVKDFDALEAKLKGPLPGALRELLAETDGVQTVSREDGSVHGWFVWPAKEIGSRTTRLRKETQGAHQGPLVFFAPGDDVTFAIDMQGQVFAWYLIDQELVSVAASLSDFVKGWVSGELTV